MRQNVTSRQQPWSTNLSPSDANSSQSYRVGWEGDSPSTSRRCRMRQGMSSKRLMVGTTLATTSKREPFGNTARKPRSSSSKGQNNDSVAVTSPLASKIKIHSRHAHSKGTTQGPQNHFDRKYDNTTGEHTSTCPSTSSSTCGSDRTLRTMVNEARNSHFTRPPTSARTLSTFATLRQSEDTLESSEQNRLEIIAQLSAVLGDSPGSTSAKCDSRVLRSMGKPGDDCLPESGQKGRIAGSGTNNECQNAEPVVLEVKQTCSVGEAGSDSDSTFDDSFILATQALEDAQAKAINIAKNPNPTKSSVTSTARVAPKTNSVSTIPNSLYMLAQISDATKVQTTGSSKQCRGNSIINSKRHDSVKVTSPLAVGSHRQQSHRPAFTTSTPVARQSQRSRIFPKPNHDLPESNSNVYSSTGNKQPANATGLYPVNDTRFGAPSLNAERVVLSQKEISTITGFPASSLASSSKRLKTGNRQDDSPDMFAETTAVVADDRRASPYVKSKLKLPYINIQNSANSNHDELPVGKLSPIVGGGQSKAAPHSPLTSPKTPISRFRDRVSGVRSPLSTSFGSNSSTEDLLADMDIPD